MLRLNLCKETILTIEPQFIGSSTKFQHLNLFVADILGFTETSLQPHNYLDHLQRYPYEFNTQLHKIPNALNRFPSLRIAATIAEIIADLISLNTLPT